MAWLRNRGDEDAARASTGRQPVEPVQLDLGLQDQFEVEIVCRRLGSEGMRLRWYSRTVTSRLSAAHIGRVLNIVLVHPDDAEYVRVELIAAGLLYVEP